MAILPTAGRRSRRLASSALAIGGSLALLLTGCAQSSEPAPASSESSGGTSTGIALNQELHDLLPAEIRSAGAIQVGVTIGDSPFMDKVGGTYEGIIPELAEAVGTILGVDMAFVDMPFPGLIPAIQSDKIQLAWTSMFNNADREQVIDMVSYAAASMGIIVQKGNPQKVQGIEDLCGLTVGTTKGTVQERALVAQQEECKNDGNPALALNLYATQNEAYTQAQAGILDAVMLTYTPMAHQASQIENGNAFDIIDWTSPAGYLAVGVSNTKVGLADAINGAILQLEASGDYEKILTEYGATPDILPAELMVVNGSTSGVLK
ncbi:transporter substrate-binding domain-containing protein [Microbacterium caowuchunii]|uniref:Transporter substrate-binding domain-containing protein n=1 Tax=Microbacterium caowuchunii TaxID=2614638 RepID=A0A5N0THM7_9MICO|nr:transporter substrate-binding domain-containing protein [Microbacterium caowuchunii]KAA9133607.1 transporter substrate-binding domain-containing protein [Microbacterium caowuchunii]